MHELMVTKELVEHIASFVKEKGVKKVTKVVVELGELTSFKKDPIIFYFDSLRDEEPALKGMDFPLEIIPVEGKAVCRNCGGKTIISDYFICENCGSNDIDVSQGKEFKIRSISYQ